MLWTKLQFLIEFNFYIDLSMDKSHPVLRKIRLLHLFFNDFYTGYPQRLFTYASFLLLTQMSSLFYGK